MYLLQFIHDEDLLVVDGAKYKATCKVRNELNGWRHDNQVVTSTPYRETSKPYYPRKFPTGVWLVKKPVWTDDIDYAPVKIPTNATRPVMLWDTNGGKYDKPSGEIQEDSFYHLHYAEKSTTTLGCIRLNSAEDAQHIAKLIEWQQLKNNIVYLEVIASRT